MKKISSSVIAIYKWAFPLLWFGGLAFAAVQGGVRSAVNGQQWGFIAMPVRDGDIRLHPHEEAAVGLGR